jgi:GT2 family glycosyltransferase
MCIGHLSVYKIDFLRSLGGFRSEFDGTQDFDLALRAALAEPHVIHLPIFAYLWRAIPGSAATDLSEKHYAIERQGKAVLDYARRRHPQAAVIPGWAAGYWRIIYPLPSTPPLLSYIIPTGGGSRVVRGQRVDLLLHCICSFEAKAFYPSREYVVIHNGDLTKIQMAELAAIPQVRLVHYEAKVFNLSEKLNLGAGTARGEYLCLLNDDVEAITPKGGMEMIGYLAANPQVGGIGPLCLREDQTIQQNGAVLLPAIGPANAADGRPRTYGGHHSALRCRREVFCVGGAIFLIRKDLYLELGGYSESLPLNFNDVDFCIRLRNRGYSCVVDPYIEAYHYEGATKLGTSIVEQEKMFMRNPGVTDPYFSPWFDPGRLDYQLILEPKPARQPFAAWLDRHISKRAKALSPEGRVKLSVCVSVYNQPKRLLEEMYQSVLMQTYKNTELVVLDNGSSNPETLQWLERIRREERAVFVRAETNLGISGGNLTLLEAMSGDFFVAMDADDFLSVDALQMIAYAIERNPSKNVFYSDEYKSDINSSRFLPFFKPDFDPILLTNCCYPAHLMAMRRDFLQQIGSYTDARATWCHDYDTITRALEIGEEPVHVREPIYAWRINPGSTASAASSGKPETTDSQRFVLNRLLQARGLEHQIKVEPKAIETSSGTWSLVARTTVPNVSTVSYNQVEQTDAAGLQIAISVATQPGTEWLAILADPDDQVTMRQLSAVALFDTRVNAVSGLLLDESRRVRWSGGVFLPGGRLFDPFSKSSFAGGGYHGLLWCQRCVDVAAPTNVLIRSSALARAARSGAGSLNALMIALGLDAHRRGEFIAITPHCASIVSNASSIPLDRAGDAIGKPELEAGSRWYDGRLETDRPYMMHGVA